MSICFNSLMRCVSVFGSVAGGTYGGSLIGAGMAFFLCGEAAQIVAAFWWDWLLWPDWLFSFFQRVGGSRKFY